MQTDAGLSEDIGRAEISYYGDRKDYHSPIRSSDLVKHVSATWELLADDSATVMWTKLSGEIVKQAGQPRCARFPMSEYRVRMASWPIGGGAIYLRQQYRDSVLAGGRWEGIPPTLVMGVVLDSAILVPAFSTGQAEPCA